MIEPDYQDLDIEYEADIYLSINTCVCSTECQQKMAFILSDAQRHLQAWILCAIRCMANEDLIYWKGREIAPMDLTYLDCFCEIHGLIADNEG